MGAFAECVYESSGLTYVALLATATAALLGVIVVRRARRLSILHRIFYTFFVIVFCGFGIVGISSGVRQAQVRLYIKKTIAINQLSECYFVLDGTALKNSEGLASEIAKVGPQEDRHSDVAKLHFVFIQWPANSLVLKLGQDSRQSEEFWLWLFVDGQYRRAGTISSVLLKEILEAPNGSNGV